MNTAALALRYLASRPLVAVLNVLLLTLGLASITFVLLASEQVESAFQRDLSGIDVVVGAKASPMQLILAGVFQLETPPADVPLRDIEALRRHPGVARLIPLVMGDSYEGFRIVGTTADYLSNYHMAFRAGDVWNLPMQAVLGAQVAQSTGLRLGDRLVATHGFSPGTEHSAAPLRVSGVLAPCGCVADRLILAAAESVWALHDRGGATPEEMVKEREVTMALITATNPKAAANLPRVISRGARLNAASPEAEVSRLLRLLGVGTDVLRGVGAVLLFTGALSVFIALWNAVRERRADLAMLRMLGATPMKVGFLLVCEALWLAVIACVLGIAAGHLLAAFAGHFLAAQHAIPIRGGTWASAEWWIPAAAIAVAVVAALIPAVTASRIDVADLLHR